MLTEEYLELNKLFAPKVLWEILPDIIPGKIKDHLLTHPNSGFIVPMIKIKYPNGEIMTEVFSSDVGRYQYGEIVLFNLKDARDEEKKKKKQPDLKQAINVRKANPNELEKLGLTTDPVKLMQLAKKLESLINEVESEKKELIAERNTIQERIEKKVWEMTIARSTELDEREKDIVTKEENITIEIEKRNSERTYQLNQQELALEKKGRALEEDLNNFELLVQQAIAEKSQELEQRESLVYKREEGIKLEIHQRIEKELLEIEKKREQLDEESAALAAKEKAFDQLVEEAVSQRQIELDNREDSLKKKEADIKEQARKAVAKKRQELDELEARIHDRENSIPVIVSEQVAEQKMELERYKAELDELEKELKQREYQQTIQAGSIEGERLQLAKSIAQFQKEGGERFISYLTMLETGTSNDHEIVVCKDTPPPSNLVDSLNRSFLASQYSLQPALITKVLVSTLTAALTGQFVILSGPTGVGKTSMVNTFSTALGAGCGVVPVRPAWIDPTDLLGFYNPQQMRFQPSPFMDRFLEAGKYSEANRMYFLALDEMNLSRVENYAADFLSRLEKARAGEKDVCINLYSKEIELSLKAEANKWRELKLDGVDFNQYISIMNHITKYPANLRIMEGLVMFGTINLDETTYHLSPKFLDRSLVINIPHQSLLSDIFRSGTGSLPVECVFDFSLQTVKSLAEKNGKTDPIDQIWKDILGWQEQYLQPLGIKPGFRFAHMYAQFMHVAKNLGIQQYYEVASSFLQAKLLPWISFNKDDLAVGLQNRTKLEILEAWASDKSMKNYSANDGLKKDLERIIQKGESAVVVSYLE